MRVKMQHVLVNSTVNIVQPFFLWCSKQTKVRFKLRCFFIRWLQLTPVTLSFKRVEKKMDGCFLILQPAGQTGGHWYLQMVLRYKASHSCVSPAGHTGYFSFSLLEKSVAFISRILSQKVVPLSFSLCALSPIFLLPTFLHLYTGDL